MRQVMIKEVSELTEVETEQLLTTYEARQSVLEFANENESYWMDEVFGCIRHSLSDWSIDEPFNSFIIVKDYQEFYSSIKELNDMYEVFSSTDIMERLKNVYNRYDDVHADGFRKRMRIIERDIASVLGNYANYYSSYEVIELESDYVSLWYETNYDTECIVDGGSVTLLNL